jgi:hypothetical protein
MASGPFVVALRECCTLRPVVLKGMSDGGLEAQTNMDTGLAFATLLVIGAGMITGREGWGCLSLFLWGFALLALIASAT